VLIARCAWHRRYYGHSKLLGISKWRGLRLDFTGGICPKCAARVRVVRQRPAAGRPQAGRGGGRTSEVVLVALAVLTGLVLIARPVNQGPAPVQVVDLVPGTATAVQTTPTPAIGAAPARPRRPRAAPIAIVRASSPAERLQSP
jgi:hypothetical protein